MRTQSRVTKNTDSLSLSRINCFTADIKLDLTKKGRRIGRDVDFCDQRAMVLEELRPDTELAGQYIVSRASTRATQFSAYSYISHVITTFMRHPLPSNITFRRTLSVTSTCPRACITTRGAGGPTSTTRTPTS